MSINLVFPEIEKTLTSFSIDQISNNRQKTLNPLADYLKEKIRKDEAIALNFICTHNSRRSHMAQVWGQTLAHYFGIKNIACYSGGTEATALFPMVTETLENSGFKIDKLSETNNPIYSIKFNPNAHPIIGFSKTFDDLFNPKTNFAAIMTCSSADEGCPMVMGADGRFPITFEDPKVFDNSPLQKEKYHERSIQIAKELFYVMKRAISTI